MLAVLAVTGQQLGGGLRLHWQSWANDPAGVLEATLAVMGQWPCRCLGGNTGSHGPMTLQVSRWQHWQLEASDPVGVYEATLTVTGQSTCGFLEFASSQWIVILRWSKEGAKDFSISSHSLVFHGLMPIHELDQLKEQQPLQQPSAFKMLIYALLKKEWAMVYI